MTLAHARSLCAGLFVQDQPATPHEDAAALRRLARWMLRYAPVVSPDDPDGLMLDISGCERLFGGEREHAERIDGALRRWGLRPRIAVAPTFACAWAVARYGDSPLAWIAEGSIERALAPLPVRALRIDAATAAALADVGIERIEHLLTLPRDELVTRFGTELIGRIDRSIGVSSETIESVRPIRRFEAVHVFDGPVRRLEIIEATARALLARLLEPVHAVQRGVCELLAELHRVDVGPQSVSVRLTHPHRQHAHLWKLLWPLVERVNLGFGVTEIYLRAVRTERMNHEQAAFLRDAAQGKSDRPVALGELVDCLVERLGCQAVTRVRPAETYVPERAFVHSAVRQIAPRASARADVDGQAVNLAHRPSQLLETPEPIRVVSLVPDGPPIRLDWRGRAGTVVVGVGPERIVSPWWSQGGAASRDYYELEDEHGRQLWVFRDAGTGNWYVHGQWM